MTDAEMYFVDPDSWVLMCERRRRFAGERGGVKLCVDEENRLL